MKNFLPLFIVLLLTGVVSWGQSDNDSALQKNDSSKTVKKDSSKKVIVRPVSPKKKVVKKKADTTKIIVHQQPVVIPPVVIPLPVIDSSLKKSESLISMVKNMLAQNPYFNFLRPPLDLQISEKKKSHQEGLFYLVLGLLYYFALIKLFFGKYLDNLLALFFRVTMRQQQLREQLVQAPLPALMLNTLFIFSTGLYLAFLIQYFGILPRFGLWRLFLYSMGMLICIYVSKYLMLKLTGWIFSVKGATDTYIFIVFLVNKMIGIFLLPVLLFMAFPHPFFFPIVLTLSFVLLIGLISYRFIISYRPIRKDINLNVFHFFLYLCAFEIAPLLLIYKVLLAFVERSY